ncbi:MAG: ABC transporter ATP-binding protein [SAR324 cluster bacterium]|jgi:tungstate transport system ATP-binding protein|nr:ABC transporter ATP-binding protein [SAR324 cluster bacterium]MDP6522234.1 ABC transporter ATP-binding protein [SAR324 cluster bacterium]|tara:strand:+ start:2231 stop:2881 length:651 start_codon:yes stop_codon:yes gene_type:complete
MNEPLFVFRGIEKTFAETNILRNVDISLYPGKCILLSGNNGSGKTTLLKIIAGLETPSRAEIELSGKSQSWKSAIRSIRREIIYLHQQPYLLSGTVESNVSYGLRFTHLNRKQLRESVKEALEWTGLSDVAKQQAKTLSGGVQQRVAFTRAWILKPKVLLLDEPVANMDIESREQACDLLKRMKSEGMSIVITSHDTNIFDGLIDINFSLSDGKLD